MLVFFCLTLFFVYADCQSFIKSENLFIKQITGRQYVDSYKNSVSSFYKFVEDKEMPAPQRELIETSEIKKYIVDMWGEQYADLDQLIWSCCELKIPSCKYSFIVTIDEPISMSTYFLDKYNQVDSIVISGCGELTNDFIYFTTELFDCDEYVLLKWYSVKNDCIKQIAELKEQSYNYCITCEDDIPGSFSDNKGNYFFSITEKKSNKIKYYKIKLR